MRCVEVDMGCWALWNGTVLDTVCRVTTGGTTVGEIQGEMWCSAWEE